MADSIFTKIVKGEVPCHKIYEDEQTMAFLDAYPKLKGHVLVIPKAQIEYLWELDDELYSLLLLNCKKIALHLRSVMGTKYVHMGVVGTEISHAHIHLIPFDNSDDLNINEGTAKRADDQELATLAQKLMLN